MVGSESDLEIVHDDGTVTDKRDGIRRPYSEHVARMNGAPAPAPAAASSSSRPRIFWRRAVVAVPVGLVTGCVGGVVAHWLGH